jgi:ATP-binding cassette subfamily F protein uup
MTRPNLVLADEPTNDLDIDTLSRLEFFLDSFPGCLCVASHDRFLLQRLCDRILIFRDGHVEETIPSVLDEVGPDFFDLQTAPSPAAVAQSTPPPAVTAKKKLSYKEQKQLEELESSIPRWESEIKDLDREMAEVSGQYGKVKELFEKKQKIEELLESGMERWAELEELKESLG